MIYVWYLIYVYLHTSLSIYTCISMYVYTHFKRKPQVYMRWRHVLASEVRYMSTPQVSTSS